jgi:hypothetical protein
VLGRTSNLFHITRRYRYAGCAAEHLVGPGTLIGRSRGHGMQVVAAIFVVAREKGRFDALPCHQASGANGNGYGAILGFGPEGQFTGPFSSDPRITDPRGLSLNPSGELVYLNSGDDRMLAPDLRGNVVRDSGPIPGLDPGGAEFGPDGRYCVTMRRQRTILAMPAALDGKGKLLLPESTVPFPRGFGFGRDGRL